MPRTLISMLAIFAILVLGFILLALRSCESPVDDPVGPIQYDNTHEETSTPESVQYSNDHIQYSNELPRTGGIRL